MAKSFIDVVKDSPRTGLGIPVKTKKPLSRTNTQPAEPAFGFKLHGWLVPLKSRTTLPSSVRSEHASAATRPLGKPTSRARCSSHLTRAISCGSVQVSSLRSHISSLL